ncbi:MAG: cytochrome c [Terracidiphilus sp.]|jgi:mono/diheme cytochrome c family protein
MLKPLLFVSAVAFFGITALSASAPTAQQTAPAASGQKNTAKPPSAQAQAHAKEIYTNDCVVCHGDNGSGKTDLAKDLGLTIEDWTDPKALADKPDQELFNIIRNGKGKMPSEDVGRAKDEEVRNIILYIRALYKRQPAAPAPVAAPAPAPETAPAPNN